MLKGSLQVFHNDKTYNYKVTGYDTSSSMMLKLHCQNFNDSLFLCNEDCEEDGTELDKRRVSIGTSKVTVETIQVTDTETGKLVKAPVNNTLFLRLGALIRYAKSHCFKRNEKYSFSMSLASKEFEAIPSTEYIIPFESTDGILAEVTLEYGSISRIVLKTDYLSLELEDGMNTEDELFFSITNGWNKGFRMDEETLGFPLKPIERSGVVMNGVYTTLDDVIKNNPDKEFEWLREMNYRIVGDDELDEVCDYIYNHNGLVYYDTETTGLNITFKSRVGQADQCVGIVLSVKDGESFYFPMQMKLIPNLCNGDHFYFMEHYMRRILEGKSLVVHNASFDWKVAYIYDINANIVHDTLAIIRLTIGTEKVDYSAGLKENTKIILKRDSLELSDLVVDNSWGESDIKFWDLPYELVKYYACADTDNTRGLLNYALQTDLLGRYNAKKVYEIEVGFAMAVGYQEFYGHRIDINNTAKMREEIGAEQDKYMKLMEDLVGHEFNPNSPKQLQTIMYQELGIPEQVSRKTGKVTTDSKALKYLAGLTDIDDNVKYPFCDYLLKYRKAEGVRKIVDKFPENVTADGYVHSGVQQYGTDTGRVSIKEPNYQSYSDPIKKNVVPRPGYWMWDTDYSSVEYRVLANMVGNKKIKKNFEDPVFDYHAYQASHMYGVPYAQVTKQIRKAAKGINFGLPYGMGDESLGATVFGDVSPENTRKAGQLRQAYFKGQEDIQDWFEVNRTAAVNNGYTETFFGRRRYYDKNKFNASAIRRQGGNHIIQGCLDGATIIEVKGIGAVPIKAMVDSHVQVWNGHDWTWGDILYSGKKQKCIITFTNGQKFICSPIHRFKVVRDTIYSYADVNPEWKIDIENDGHIGGLFTRCKHLKKGTVIEINTDTSKHCIKDFDNARFINKECIGSCDDDSGDTYTYNATLECVEVESVEITDEWIDMYDVCNTDCGYYVADGIITHNTAADIYKLATSRIFKRICKEGWLGKVLLNAFVHDELLGECSNDINPATFLKVLREEFEVKITDENGEPWCPLYMGFGYGMSWYEAKSVELPIKLQWEIVEKYGVSGFDFWNGNGYDLCSKVPDMLRDFHIRDIIVEITDKDAQGKEIKPSVNSDLLECIADDVNLYMQAINNGVRDKVTLFEKYHIYDFIYSNNTILEDLDGFSTDTFKVEKSGNKYKVVLTNKKSIQGAIDLFCILHGVSRETVDILDIAEYSASASSPVNDYNNYTLENDDSEVDNEQLKFERMMFRVKTFGVNIDIDNKSALLLLPTSNNFINILKTKVNSVGDGYNISFYNRAKNEINPTPYYLSSVNIDFVSKMYLNSINQF